MRTSILEAFAKRANYRVTAKSVGWLDKPGLIGDGVNYEIYATVPRTQVLDYYMVKIIGRVDGWGSYHESLQSVGPSQYGWSEEDNYYWERRILFPWEFETHPTPAPDAVAIAVEVASAGVQIEAPAPPPQSASQDAAAGVIKQGGLLQDDILYNLSLLCANVLEPLKQRYPNITVISGLRQFNTGMSQHEKGEAADIQINGQTDELLYQVADYIAKNLQFDQVILNYSNAPKLSWIHVSFSAQELRRSVLTRDYDDTYHDGLFYIQPLSGEERAAAERAKAEDMAAVDAELGILSVRDAAIHPRTAYAEIAADEAAYAAQALTFDLETTAEGGEGTTASSSGSGWTQDSQGNGGGYD